MKTIKTEIKLYEYDELNDEAKEKAFEEHKEFLWNVGQEYMADGGEIKMDYSEPEKEEVEESIRINEYWFFANGEMANCTTYTGKHEKAGITEFKFNDKVYVLK